MRRVLERLEVEWTRQGATVLSNLAPGITDDEIDATLPTHVALPEEARELFRWRNGTLEAGPPYGQGSDFGLGWQYPPLAALVEEYRDWGAWMEEAASVLGTPVLWSPNWFPVFLTQGGDRLLVELDKPVTPLTHRVVAVSATAPDDSVELTGLKTHWSLISLLETWSALLAARLVTWDATAKTWAVNAQWDTYRAALRAQ